MHIFLYCWTLHWSHFNIFPADPWRVRVTSTGVSSSHSITSSPRRKSSSLERKRCSPGTKQRPRFLQDSTYKCGMPITSLLMISWVRAEFLKSLGAGRCGCNSKSIIFKFPLQNINLGTHCKIALMWMSWNVRNQKSTLVQVMSWCHQATSQYLSQCWLRSLSPCGTTRPHWVKLYINGADKYLADHENSSWSAVNIQPQTWKI